MTWLMPTLLALLLGLREKVSVSRPSLHLSYVDPAYGCPRVPICSRQDGSAFLDVILRVPDPLGAGFWTLFGYHVRYKIESRESQDCLSF